MHAWPKLVPDMRRFLDTWPGLAYMRTFLIGKAAGLPGPRVVTQLDPRVSTCQLVWEHALTGSKQPVYLNREEMLASAHVCVIMVCHSSFMSEDSP